MKQNSNSQSGIFNPRVLIALGLCSVGAFLAMLSFAATPPIGMTGSRTNSPGDSLFVGQHAGPLRGKANTAAALRANLAVSVDPSFTAVGSMTTPRYRHTATLLGNGKVLITGGGPNYPEYAPLNTAELFDPASGTYTALPPMTKARLYHTATLLPNGKVLITGTSSGSGTGNTAEMFDPASGTFTSLSNTMILARYGHTATLLPNGKVLIAGGFTPVGATKSAELFDPASGTFTALPSMTKERFIHTATLLGNGKVLMAGGNSPTTNTAELFDPASGTFTALPNMNSVRDFHTATLLPGGKVLMAGGNNWNSGPTNTAELFDPAAGSFMLLPPMTSVRQGHTATLLPSGKVLLAGGDQITGPTNTAELFDPATGTFASLAPSTMTSARAYHTATLLTSGKVLLAGGYAGRDPVSAASLTTNTAELSEPASGTFTSLLPNTMNLGRQGHTATLLPNGKVFIAGGATGDGVTTAENTDTAELFDPATGTFTLVPSTMTSRRNGPTATLLPSGKVLIAGGFGFAYRNTAELFDPASGTFTLVPGTMSFARNGHTATLLPSGKVLIAGGRGNSGPTNTAELFDPASGTFTLLPPMTLVRYFHTATMLPSGKVLITGGTPGDAILGAAPTNTAELFDTVSGTFTALPPMTSPRAYHTATLLPSGKILITGGDTGTAFSNTAELFDPASGTFTSLLKTMTSERYFHQATLLQSGTVLITGGGNLIQGQIDNSAELFDPTSGTFTALPPMTAVRYFNTTTLLANGKVLIAGGPGNPRGVGTTNTAELFDAGLGFSDARRPVISTVTNPLVQPASLVLTGTGFRGDSEASGSSFSSSATNYPILQLMRIDSEQTFFALSDPATNWSDTTFSSAILGSTTPLPPGQYRVTVFTNAIPSLQKIINIGAPPLQLVSAVSRKTHGLAGTFDVNLPFSFNLPIPRPGIECRAGGGTGGDHMLVFTFNTIPVSGSATVASGTGSVAGSPTFSGNTMSVTLTGVANAQVIGVTLNVTDSFGQTFSNPEGIPVNMGVLLGDVNATGVVTSGDTNLCKAQALQPVTNSNFRSDINASGSITTGDVNLIKQNALSQLPP
jgi:hypothetical protein